MKTKVKVFENYRIYDDPENPLKFMTDEVCEYCGCQTENYINLKPIWNVDSLKNHLICKGCLSEFINILNEDFQKLMKNSKRG